ncbi:MAG: VWA domain-containing protein [Thermoguttaceae bacterium]|nr:VWA domain-containing protein [Thermoguttaceae bacterium]
MERKLPVYLLIDTSGSMKGERIAAVEEGLDALLRSLRENPLATQCVWLSVITYDLEAKILVPYSKLEKVGVPDIPTPQTSPTNLGEALELLYERFHEEFTFTVPNRRGDYKPIAIIMTDGAPSDTQLFKAMAEKIRKEISWSRVICLAVGGEARIEPLKKLTDEVYSLESANAATFAKFWDFASDVIKQQSSRVSAGGAGVSRDPELPDGIRRVD